MARKKIPDFAKDKITIAGKRKTAIAKATIRAGTGIVRINKRPISSFNFLRRLALEEPLRITEDVLKNKPNFDIQINVKGGGTEAQIQASRLALARAIVKFTNSAELKRAFLNYDRSLLIADVRRKEQYKPGDSKARKKRQKSYR
jgi:small subunit ribosomal protein S9